MRKRFYALPMIAAAFSPLLARAATDVCARVSGKGLLDGVCQECYANGQCQIADFFIVGNTITKLILGLSGSVMLLMVVYGGFIWLTSSGNSNLVDKGKKVLIGSVIGLIIVFGAYTATQFLVASMVCRAGESCTAVNEIFARPFQLVKPPGTGTTKPPATTTPAAGTTTPTGNPTAGTTTPSSGSCKCSMFFDNPSGSKQIMKESTCTLLGTKGLSCSWEDGSVNKCSCDGTVPTIGTKDDCNIATAMDKLGIPADLEGIRINGSCDWKE